MLPIEIPLYKTKLIGLLLASFIFVAIGIWFVVAPPVVQNPVFGNPALIFGAGIASILFFGLAGVFIFKKINDKSPGLIVANDGITDNTNGFSPGFVPWSDVLEIKEMIIANQPLLNLVVKNPQDYIDRQESKFKKAALKLNYETSGTIISITANSLKYDYQDLKMLLEHTFADYKRKHPTY